MKYMSFKYKVILYNEKKSTLIFTEVCIYNFKKKSTIINNTRLIKQFNNTCIIK